MTKTSSGSSRLRLSLAVLLLLSVVTGRPADLTNAPPAVSGDAAETELRRAYLQVQAHLQATQLMLDRNRQEAEATAARNTDLLETRLRLLEQALVGERARELDSLERSQRLLLIFAAVFAGVGLLAILLSTYAQWRAADRLVQWGAALRLPPALAQPPSTVNLGPGTESIVPYRATESSDARLVGAVERLEQRIRELEQTTRPPIATSAPPSGEGMSVSPSDRNATDGSARVEAEHRASQIDLLLAKGQTLLELSRVEEALACFDDALRLDPEHSETLLKKAAALEQARKPEEAIACYDRAIATDQTFTLAYLQKGGLCNRLERYEEALRCYEEALKAQSPARQAG
jgi:tetratricopeptide (TPR) repeat protein